VAVPRPLGRSRRRRRRFQSRFGHGDGSILFPVGLWIKPKEFD
jgi:hypothetical protein